MFLNVPKCKIIAADRIREALPEQAHPLVAFHPVPSMVYGIQSGNKNPTANAAPMSSSTEGSTAQRPSAVKHAAGRVISFRTS